VHAAYPEQSAAALTDVSLDVPRGARWALLGLNGSGKSTLLRVLAGVLRPRGGEARIFGVPVSSARSRVAYLPQRGEINWQFPVSARDFVRAGRYVHAGWLRRTRRNDHRLADEALEHLGVEALGAKRIAELSGGQQQRIMIARAMAQKADLLLLDEPLNAVDVETRVVVMRVLRAQHEAGVTLLMATHDVAGVEMHFDGMTALKDGRVVDTGDWLRLASHHAAMECGRPGAV